MKAWHQTLVWLISALCLFNFSVTLAQEEQGVTETTIRIGGVMDLEGRSRGLGQGMRKGLEAAFKDQAIKGRSIEFITLDDSYTPAKTVESVNTVLEQNVFALIGNVGTPTAAVSLPILAENSVPAIGFFTGAGLLRPGEGDIVNYRASYVQETRRVISSALSGGIPANQICAYVQNDAYGMAGVEGIRRALAEDPQSQGIIERLERILAFEGANPPRNGVGPVGVYIRNTFEARDGYLSLKAWEQEQGASCRIVITVGTYNAISQFAGYSRYKGEDWIISAVSFTGADNFREALEDLDITENVIMTQVVPVLESTAPIVNEARRALGEDFGYVSLEGYIVGKMFLRAMNLIVGPITRQKFLDIILGTEFFIGGMYFDMRTDNQASNLVAPTILRGGRWQQMGPPDWQALFN